MSDVSRLAGTRKRDLEFGEVEDVDVAVVVCIEGFASQK